MSNIGVRIAVTAAIIALALPASAAARGGGHGGGGGHFGGGFHMGGGGGGMHLSAPAFSRAPSFARPSFSTGAVRSFSGTTFRTYHDSRSMSGLGLGPRGISRMSRWSGGSRSMRHVGGVHRARTTFAARHVAGITRAARIAAPHLAAPALAGSGAHVALAAAHGMRWQHHADWRRHRGFFGWAGPVFWPYFYDDLCDDVLWDDGPYYEDPFWAYGYRDIYGALFSPYGYDELAGWAPARSVRSAVAPNAPGEPGQPNERSQPNEWSAMCGDDARDVANLPIDRISAAVSPDDQQRAALDALANATTQAAQAIKAACPADVAFTPTGRLDAMEQRVRGMVQAVALIRPPLENFYKLLSDEQKARFTAIGHEPRERSRQLIQACGPNAVLPRWPQAQIDTAVRPSEGQRVLLDKLRDANAKAADMLKAACPNETAATPPGRLAAVAQRLDALLTAIQEVHPALNDFYGSLTDEQKAQFNGIPAVVQIGAPRG
jgi:LTXXQ motif family protein